VVDVGVEPAGVELEEADELGDVEGFFGRVEDIGDPLGETLGAGAREANGGDNLSVGAAETDEPYAIWWPSSGAGGVGVDLDSDGLHGEVSFGGGVLCSGQDRDGPLEVRASSY
jgi:hypothetical protein